MMMGWGLPLIITIIIVVRSEQRDMVRIFSTIILQHDERNCTNRASHNERVDLSAVNFYHVPSNGLLGCNLRIVQ